MPHQCCQYGLFESADRSWRCKGCHLNPDACNCSPEKRERLLRMLGLKE